MTIYDYANRAVNVDLPDKEIREIQVEVITGDETGTVEFTDGTKIEFDSSDDRIAAFFDGCYCVTGDRIQEWLDFKPSSDRTASYERIGRFIGDD